MASLSSFPDPEPNRGIILASGLALGVAGGIARSVGLEDEAAFEKAKSELATVRDKAARDELVVKQEQLDFRSGVELSSGWAGIAIGGSLLAAGLVSLAGIRFRRALLAVGLLPFIAASYFAVFHAGPEALVPVTLVGVAACLYLSWESDQRGRNEVKAFAGFPGRHAKSAAASGYRDRPTAKPSVSLSEAVIPAWGQRVLPEVGGGKFYKSFLLKKDLAYVAFVEADVTDVSDYTTVVLRFEQKEASFVARPLPLDDGRPMANTGLLFREDREFSAEYLVEVAPGENQTRVREFLVQSVRDELLGLPDVWLRVSGTVATLTRFGRFDAKRAEELVEIADAIFADYGAEGGPSLMEPDGLVKKKKSKHKSNEAFSPIAT